MSCETVGWLFGLASMSPRLTSISSSSVIATDFCDPEIPPEGRRLGRTIGRWADQIVAWHRSHVSNGPTEAVNNLVKRVKRVAFGMRNFAHYRIRSLLYAGKPNWTHLNDITPS